MGTLNSYREYLLDGNCIIGTANKISFKFQLKLILEGCLGYSAPGPRPSYPALCPRRPKNVKLAPLTQSPVTMIMLYGFMGYLNHVDLLMPHVHVLKKHPIVYCALKLFCEFYPVSN